MVCGGKYKKFYSDDPIITVVTVVYNGEAVIEKTIKSVIEQTYNNIEYLIIDGNSSDLTLSIIKKFEDNISYWQSENDLGIYDAMNKGINLAKGQWLLFMNAGDVFFDRNVVNNIFKNKNYSEDVIFGDSVEISDNTEKIMICSKNSDLLLKYPTYRHGASFVKVSVLKEFLFALNRVDLGFALDYYQIYRIKITGHKFLKINSCIIKFEKDGISNNVKKAALYNFRITRNKKPFYSFARYLFIKLKILVGAYR